MLGNQVLSFQGRDKDKVHSEMYQQLYFLIKSGSVKFTANQYFYQQFEFCVRAEALEGGPASRLGHPPQLEKVQRQAGGNACKMQGYTKLVNKIGLSFSKGASTATTSTSGDTKTV